MRSIDAAKDMDAVRAEGLRQIEAWAAETQYVFMPLREDARQARRRIEGERWFASGMPDTTVGYPHLAAELSTLDEPMAVELAEAIYLDWIRLDETWHRTLNPFFARIEAMTVAMVAAATTIEEVEEAVSYWPRIFTSTPSDPYPIHAIHNLASRYLHGAAPAVGTPTLS
jgi:hypothetical protein